MNRRTLLAMLIAAPAAAAADTRGAAIYASGLPRGFLRHFRGPTRTYPIDARGATPDMVARLPEILRENNARLEARIRENVRRGR